MHRRRTPSLPRARKLLIVPLICATVFLMTGCVTLVHSGGNTYLTFWQRTTDTLVNWYNSPQCAQDINHNGSIDPTDRADCTFFLTRVNICNRLDTEEKLYCYAGTDPKYATNFAYEVLGRGLPCFAIEAQPGGVYSWGQYNIGQVGCRY
jgi:hypothetical protein